MKGIQHTLLSYAAAAVFLHALWWAIALLLALPIVPTPDKVTSSHMRPGASGASRRDSAWPSASAIRLASSWATSGGPTAISRPSST